MKHTTYIIGCGGVGSWLVPMLKRLDTKVEHTLHLFDGDRFEPKNLDRQLFSPSHIGLNKAEVIAKMYGCEHTPEYFSPGWLHDATPEDWIIVCADNNAARKAALETSDQTGAGVIIGANEYTDAEAYLYHNSWKGEARDPRIYYPAILTDTADDPVRAGAGCTGEVALATPQLVLANIQAAVFAAELYWWHTQYRWEFIDDAVWPRHHKKNQFAYKSVR